MKLTPIVVAIAIAAGATEAAEKIVKKPAAASAKPLASRTKSKPVLRSAAEAAAATTEEPKIPQPCNWWVHFDRCEGAVEGLPPEAPREGTIITVDTTKNVGYLWKDGVLVSKAPVATGMDKWLEKGDRKWLFRTPRGRHVVLGKIVDPVWHKPDWAYVEEGRKIPPYNAPDRKVKGKLGKYALDLGDGILIHGTDEPGSLGKKASHGCIRVGTKLLEKMFVEAPVGTEVWIF